MTFDPYFDPFKDIFGSLTPLIMFRTKNHTRKVRLTAKGLMKYKITGKYFLLHLMALDLF